MPAESGFVVPEGIAVGELIKLEELRTRVAAGRDGLGRRVGWAHHTDTATPWDWHDPGDLVLTSGAIVPPDPAGQVEFVERMHAASLAGLVVGEDASRTGSTIPVLSPEMLAAADRLGFPVLIAEYSVPYVRYVRTVAAANASEQTRLLMQIVRLHNEVHRAISNGFTSAELVDGLAEALGFPFRLVEPERWEPVLPGCPVPDRRWQSALIEQLTRRAWKVPHLIRAEVDRQLAMVTPVPVARTVFVVVEAESTAETTPSVTVLQHLASACALEIARVDAEAERTRRWGSDLLTAALDGRVDPHVFEAGLAEHGFAGPWVCLAVGGDPAIGAETIDRIARTWSLGGLHYLLTGREAHVIALLEAGAAEAAGLDRITAGEHCRIGISDPFTGSVHLGDAVRQARWALETVPQGVGHYGDDGDDLLPRTLTEAARIAESILGPLLAYDRETDSDLVATLRAYLESDRSPTETAKKLFLHKQTVSYRITRIQSLTGRSLRSTRDISELWFGLRALALSRTGPPG
ncbi:PucR family transcriptional regulator [Amycolatopsis jejuensis]|uniref:PucR family transcriptional regulator n=1 Tax=Amycolatopsis jejuensis TaxID=330084 RepID=UPI000AD93377|nr:PucR family transcriptional regulator [Amycolatopsis jejuensis]